MREPDSEQYPLGRGHERAIFSAEVAVDRMPIRLAPSQEESVL
jgi:hypothetical protein